MRRLKKAESRTTVRADDRNPVEQNARGPL
jgi:hypothetical protein